MLLTAFGIKALKFCFGSVMSSLFTLAAGWIAYEFLRHKITGEIKPNPKRTKRGSSFFGLRMQILKDFQSRDLEPSSEYQYPEGLGGGSSINIPGHHTNDFNIQILKEQEYNLRDYKPDSTAEGNWWKKRLKEARENDEI